MKTKLTTLICILFLTVANVQAQTSSTSDSSAWKTYTIRGEEFSFALPSLPAVDIKYRPVRELNLTRKEILVGSYADGVLYIICAFEKSRQSLGEFIREQRGEGSAATESDLSRDGLSGKQFVYSERLGMVQYLAGKDRNYMFRVAATLPNDPRVTKFFDSLKFGKPVADATEIGDGPGLPFEPVDQPAAAEDVTTQKLPTGKEVDRKIRLGMKPEPIYTEPARQAGITGTVVLKCIFRSNGSVTDIRIVSGLPYGLTENAVDAAKKIKYFPAVKDGKFVSMWMQLEYNFNLY